MKKILLFFFVFIPILEIENKRLNAASKSKAGTINSSADKYDSGETVLQSVLSKPVSVVFEGEHKSHIHTLSVTYRMQDESVYFLENKSGKLSKIDSDGKITQLDTLLFEYSDEFHFMESKYNGDGLYFWEVGLGEVYEYNFEDKSLINLSNTSLNKFMFGHGGVVDKNNQIMVWGGYGFWEYRSLLLKFDTVKKEWLLESDTYPGSSTVYYPNLLWYNHTSSNLISFSRHKLDRFDNRTVYKVDSYDLNEMKWSVTHSFIVKEGDFKINRALYQKDSYSSDFSNNIHHISERHFYNSGTKTLLRIEDLKYPKLHIFGAFYSPGKQEWILYGNDTEKTATNLTVLRIPSNEIQFTEVSTLSYYGFLFTQYWWIILTFIGVSVVGFQFVKRNGKSADENFKIKISGGNTYILNKGSQTNVNDVHMKRALELICTMKKKNKNQILINEFDEYVFYETNADSFRSKKRNQLFKELNQYNNSPLIETVSNSIDKRYREIVVNLKQIEVINT